MVYLQSTDIHEYVFKALNSDHEMECESNHGVVVLYARALVKHVLRV